VLAVLGEPVVDLLPVAGSLNFTRVGAAPPTRAELEAARSAR
jgi:hypothetical protein